MERNEYLTMCRDCAIIKEGKPQRTWRKFIPVDLLVMVDDRVYIPYAYRLRFDGNGKAVHDAILYDVAAKYSILSVDLKDVKK